MKLENILSQFLSLTGDAVAIARRAEGKEYSHYEWVNDPFCEMFGMAREEAIGSETRHMHHRDYFDDFYELVSEALESGRNRLTGETLCVRGSGEPFWASISMFLLPDPETGEFCSGVVLRDISEVKDREQAAELAVIERERLFSKLEAAQGRLMGAIHTIPDPFVIFDRDLRLTIWNPAYAESISSNRNALKEGMTAREVLELGLKEGRFPEANGREELWLSRVLDGLENDTSGKSVMMDVGDRHYKVIRNHTPGGDRLVVRTDITEFVLQQRELERYAEELERANTEISHQARHDELTGLGNRRYLADKLEEFVAWRERSGMEIATLHIDLDRFKQINDTMGHAAGDFVLESVSERLRLIMRRTDVIARVGGDEFITIMRCDAGSDDPERLANRLVDDLSRPLIFEGRQCRFGASVGIARTPLVPPEDLLTSSDIALYKAKESGRSRAVTFDEADLETLKFNKCLTEDILRGLENSEFIPFYQPQVDPRTFKIVGFEALARWQHPERGLLSPSAFLDAASDIRADGQIDRMIFDKALDQLSGLFADAVDVPNLSFNASLQRIMDSRLIDDVARLQDYPGKVSLELLETIFLEEEADQFLMRIDTLRDYGLIFEVDDFGSGRASIVALKRIAPERLKIDRRLVAPITESDQARKLVQSIVEIGRAMDIGVTAEGAETAEHARLLRDMGCDRVQGYHFARPMCFEDIEALMRDGQPFARTA